MPTNSFASAFFFRSQRGENGDRADPSREPADSSRGERHNPDAAPPPVYHHHTHHFHPDPIPNQPVAHPRPPVHVRARVRTNVNPPPPPPSAMRSPEESSQEMEIDRYPGSMPVPPTPRPQPIGRREGGPLPESHPSSSYVRNPNVPAEGTEFVQPGLDSPHGNEFASRFPLPQWGLNSPGGLFVRPEQPVRSGTILPYQTLPSVLSGPAPSRSYANAANASSSTSSLFTHPAPSGPTNLPHTSTTTSAFSRAFHFVPRLGLGGAIDRGSSAPTVPDERDPFGAPLPHPPVQSRRSFFRRLSGGPMGNGEASGSRAGMDTEMTG